MERLVACSALALMAYADIGLREFVRAGSELRSLCLMSQPPAPETREAIHSPVVGAEPDLVIEKVEANTERAGSRWRVLPLDEVATGCRLASSELKDCLRRSTYGSYVGCRRVAVVRRVAIELADSDEHIWQIAYTVGYSHPTALNRDRDRVISMSARR
jgi:hypothetical protein